MGILRTRMEQDLLVRGRAAKTRDGYLRVVADLAKHYHRSPDQLTDREVQQYLVHLIQERTLAWSSCRVAASALRFFYETTLGRARAAFTVPLPQKAQKLPEILSREEVARLLASVANRKHRPVLMTTYAGGLRVSEVVRLQLRDIDSQRMLIRVEDGKGRKDRYTFLSQRLLVELRGYYRVYRPTEWLFPRRGEAVPMSTSSAQHIYNAAKARAGIRKQGSIHSLRHAFATHLIESGIDVVTLQSLLGHGTITTTRRYVHLSAHRVAAHVSPLDQLPPFPVTPA